MEYQVWLFLILDKKKALYSGAITRTAIPSSQFTNSIFPNLATPTHLHIHPQLHYLSEEKQLPQNRTFSIKETRIPLTFKKKKKRKLEKGCTASP